MLNMKTKIYLNTSKKNLKTVKYKNQNIFKKSLLGT